MCAAGDDKSCHAGGAFFGKCTGTGLQGRTGRENIVSKVSVFDTIER